MGETLMCDIAAKVEGCNGASSSKVIEALNKNNSFKADASHHQHEEQVAQTLTFIYCLPYIKVIL